MVEEGRRRGADTSAARTGHGVTGERIWHYATSKEGALTEPLDPEPRLSADITGNPWEAHLYAAIAGTMVGMAAALGAALWNGAGEEPFLLYVALGMGVGGGIGAAAPTHRVRIESVDDGIAIDRIWAFWPRTRTVYEFPGLIDVRIREVERRISGDGPSEPDHLYTEETLRFVYQDGEVHRRVHLSSSRLRELVEDIRRVHRAWRMRRLALRS